MKHFSLKQTLHIGLALLLFLTTATALAPAAARATNAASDTYELFWWTVDSGGVTSGGVYTLAGTAGQAEAATMSGGTYSLGGGFLGGGSVSSPPTLYLPLISR